jgi:Rod binding domain-containing protein
MNYGFEVVSREEAQSIGLPNGSGLFDELYHQMNQTIKKETRGTRKGKTELEVGKAVDLEKYENQKYISFLNRYFVYKKVRDVNPNEVRKSMLTESPHQEQLERQLTERLEDVVKKVEKSKQEKKPKKKGKMKLIVAE